MPLTTLDKENATEFKAALKIKRLDYNIGNKSMIRSNEVIININCEEKKQESAQL